MGLIKFFINQYKLVNLIIVIITIWGALIFINGQKEGFPNITLDIISITTVYPGASPKEIEILITKQIEDAIDGVDGKKRIISSSIEGLSTITFEISTDSSRSVERVLDDIKNEVGKAASKLPEGAEDPVVTDLSFDAFPVISVFIAGDVSEEELRKVTKDFEADAKKIEGVDSIEFEGYREKQVWVQVDPEKLKSYDLQMNDIINAIRLRNINLPGGKINIEQVEYLIRTVGQYRTPEEVANTIVRANDIGNVVYVRDIADVSFQFKERENITRVNGSTGIKINVLKKASGDIITVASAVKSLMDKYKLAGEIPEGIKMFESDDFSYYVERRLGILSGNATVGLVLIFICLIIFFDIRTTLWTTLGIPVAFCAAMLVANGIGLTLNMMSMFGFIIVVGMIVDDAVIVAENVYRHREMGKSMYEAAIEGTHEVLIPIIATITTTMGAFLPLMLLSGIYGQFLGVIPKVVVITMLMSFIECIFVLPGHLAHMKEKKKAAEKDVSGKRAWFKVVQNKYTHFLKRVLKHPKKSFGVMILLGFIIVGIASQFLPFVFFPGEVAELMVTVETDNRNSLEKTMGIMDKIEAKVRENIGDFTREFITGVGYVPRDDGFGNRLATHIGSIRIILKPGTGVSEEFLNQKVEEATNGIGGLEAFNVTKRRGGPPTPKAVEIKVYGTEYQDMISAADFLAEEIKKISNTTSVKSSYEEGKREIVLNINEKKAAGLGVSINSTAFSVKNAFDGGVATVANTMKGEDEDIDIVVKYQDDIKWQIDDLKTVGVANDRGRNIPLGVFANPETNSSLALISRLNKEKYLTVSAEVINQRDVEYSANNINLMIKEKLPEWEKKYPNVWFDIAGGQQEQQELIDSVILALTLAILSILCILTALFKSYIQPIVVMSAIPFAIIGVMLGLIINQEPIGLMPFLGIVALTGVIVNDSLILVSFANRKRAEGLSCYDALVEAGSQRLRPIIITSVTTIVGLAPLAYGILGEEPFLAPMGIAFMWGLFFGTAVILVGIPVLYMLFDGALVRFYRLIGREYQLSNKQLRAVE